MIRLAALLCGLLCGAGFVLSGLHAPNVLLSVLTPEGTNPLGLGLVLLVAVLVAAGVIAPVRRRGRPLLGGAVEAVPGGTGWKPVASALVFGLGWGLAGYFPLAALVSAGFLSPGAPIFLAAALAGMILVDVLTGAHSSGSGRRGSRG